MGDSVYACTLPGNSSSFDRGSGFGWAAEIVVTARRAVSAASATCSFARALILSAPAANRPTTATSAATVQRLVVGDWLVAISGSGSSTGICMLDIIALSSGKILVLGL